MPDCPRCRELTKKAAQWHQRMLAAKSRVIQLEAALEKCAKGAFIMQQRGELINIAKQVLNSELSHA